MSIVINWAVSESSEPTMIYISFREIEVPCQFYQLRSHILLRPCRICQGSEGVNIAVWLTLFTVCSYMYVVGEAQSLLGCKARFGIGEEGDRTGMVA